jgi:hypothetical protein
MAKKNFTGGLSSLLGDTPKSKPEEGAEPTQPASTPKEITKTSQIGTKANETRATFIVNEEVLAKVKAIAYWDRLDIKDVVGLALANYLSSYEKANGPIKPIPQK